LAVEGSVLRKGGDGELGSSSAGFGRWQERWFGKAKENKKRGKNVYRRGVTTA